MPFHVNSIANPAGGAYIGFYRIRSTSQLEQNGGGTKYVLHPGTYYFDTETGAPFILDKPLELNITIPSATVEIIANIVYVGAGPLFDQALGDQTILRLSGTVLIGDPTVPSRTCFNLSYNGVGTPPVLLLDFVQMVLWQSIGTVTGFSTVVIANYADQFNIAGLQLIDTFSLVSINTLTITNNLAPGRRISIEQGGFAVTGTSAQISAVQFTPATVDASCFYFDPLVVPDVSISGGTFTVTGLSDTHYIDIAGLTGESRFVKVAGTKNVPDSGIGGGYIGSPGFAAPYIQTFLSATQWAIIPGGSATTPPVITDETDRVDIVYSANTGSRSVITVNSLEETRVMLRADVTATIPSGSSTMLAGIFRLEDDFSADSNVAVADRLTTVGHGLVNGDLVWAGNTTGTITPLSESQFFYVTVIDVDNFELYSDAARTAKRTGFAARTWTFTRCVALGNQVEIILSSVQTFFSSPRATVLVATGTYTQERFVVAASNRTTTVNFRYGSVYFTVNE